MSPEDRQKALLVLCLIVFVLSIVLLIMAFTVQKLEEIPQFYVYALVLTGVSGLTAYWAYKCLTGPRVAQVTAVPN